MNGRRTVTRNALPLNGSKIARRRRKAVPMGKHTANADTGVVEANKGLKQGTTAGSVATHFHLTDKKGVLRVRGRQNAPALPPLPARKRVCFLVCLGFSVLVLVLVEGGGTCPGGGKSIAGESRQSRRQCWKIAQSKPPPKPF